MPDGVDHPLSNRAPGEIIARRDGEAVRVDEFFGHALRLSKALPERPYAINLCRRRYDFLLGFCAAIIAGQCTLLPPNRQRQTLLRIAGDYEGAYVLGDEAIDGIDFCPVDVAGDVDGTADVPPVADEQLCAIVFTSGSTGESRPNRKTFRTLRLGIASNARLVLGGDREPLELIATVPPQHMWGLEMSILLPLFANVTIGAKMPFFPQDIVDALDELPRPRALVSSPVHLDALIKADIRGVPIDRIFTATAPMSAEAAGRLEETFDSQVIDVFGCTESGIIAARRPSVATEWQLADTIKLEATREGTMIVADHLEEPVPLNDRVELLGGGRFTWVGRDEDMVNIAGKRASLAELNGRLNAVDGVRDGVIFMPDGPATRLAALVVAPDLSSNEILDGLRDSVDPAFLPRPVRRVPALPRQETGKLPRKAVLELFARTARESAGPADGGDLRAHDA